MGLLDYVSTPRQAVAYLFPEIDPIGQNRLSVITGSGGLEIIPILPLKEVFVFQFWPQQVTDNYTPNYATKQIPGASHPLYQWTGGNGRTISFTANFVSELREDVYNPTLTGTFQERFATGKVSDRAGGGGRGGPLTAGLLPSTRYKINVAAALAALQQYLYPTYGADQGVAKPPRKLVLVLPQTKLGRAESADGILCIMKSASVTMESWFPSGELRSASVSLEFAEIIQYTQGEGSNIKYIGAEAYTLLAAKYQVNVGSASDLTF